MFYTFTYFTTFPVYSLHPDAVTYDPPIHHYSIAVSLRVPGLFILFCKPPGLTRTICVTVGLVDSAEDMQLKIVAPISQNLPID